jgi:hypothetical protein
MDYLMKKAPYIFTALFCCQMSSVQAQTPIPGAATQDKAAPALNALDEMVYNDIASVAGIAVGCELNEGCITLMINDFVKKNPTPGLQVYKQILDANKKQIDEDAINCNSDQILAFKKEIAPCMNIGFDDKKTILKMNDQEIEKAVNACMLEKSEKAAQENNLYATSILIALALEAKDQTKFKYWYGKLRLYGNTTEIQTAQSCEKAILAPIERLEDAMKGTLKYYLTKYNKK